MWREFMTVATRICGLSPAFEEEHDLTLLIEADMGEEPAGSEAFSALLSDFYEEGLIKDAVVAQSQADRNRFWAYRETPYEYGRYLPEEIRFDVSVPLDRMTEAVEHLRQELPKQYRDAIWVVFGHVADSNIHINVAIKDMTSDTKKGVQNLVYEMVSRLGGSVSAEHGIGRIKRPYLNLSRNEPELALMLKMKQTLDPEGILNPGRVL
jgi:FAD/FMN-containing dehydrogenase